MHTAACKEFYANLTVFIYKKKEIARSRVREVKIKFDNMKLASILNVPGHIVDKQGEEPKRYDYLEEIFLTMCKLKRENRVWWLGTGENRRRDDDEEVNADEQAVHEEEQNPGFDWEAVVNEADLQGESGSGEKFYDAEDEIQEPATVVKEVSAVAAQASAQQKETEASGVDPSGPSGHILEAVMIKLQAEFERARANRIQADLEKVQAEHTRLLTLLQQAKSPPKP
ncbi:hypothetical protein Dimus_018128 [Dionaea muscipula]